ncbi:aluminum-activated malate transporter 10-like [Phalaenopsis equestris]|uniref:aluminum-activated malate transporter 10-like n=1 Tax=Phalaenopsis equestris TaxID=78828 RepID=UPI0009E5805D|nr:aluminum-activated malate transporter 10-like [Phalaenopsis equestris]
MSQKAITNNNKEESGKLEWRITVPHKPSAQVAEPELTDKLSSSIQSSSRFLKNAWKMGADDPRKLVHCIKVGVALTLVSIFYYSRPLYQGVGGTAMWAIMTIVVIFEFTVGGTLYKGLNRVMATLSAGMVAIGIHWLASKSTKTSEHIIVGASAFIISSVATFVRFVPAVKARFDYGMLIFILTFNFIAVSGYRVERLLELAQERLATVAIGISICLLVCILVCPVWAGEELHQLMIQNMRKLADSLEESVAEYFREGDKGNGNEVSMQNSRGYKCVLNSKATEETLANLAKWEPVHGRFSYQYPWGQYLRVGTAMRHCAYCIETLNACIISENQNQQLAPDHLKKHISHACLKLGLESSNVLRELASSIESMKRSANIEVLIEQMNDAAEKMQSILSTPPPEDVEPKAAVSTVPLMEVMTEITVASLLNEIALRIEGVADMVEDLAEMASFQSFEDERRTNKLTAGLNGQESDILRV